MSHHRRPAPSRESTLPSTTRLSACLGRLACGLLVAILAGVLGQVAQAEPMWTTYHRDAQRSGDDPDASSPVEPVLAWQTVNLGAPMWNQPLVLGDRVYAATVGDKVYALEAASGEVVWEKSVGTPVPASKLPCGDVEPTVGVVGTPVIDSDTGTIYVVADRWDATTEEVKHVLVGLSLASGKEVLSTNVDPPGADPKALLQRTALNLDGGQVVFGMGGNNGDCGAYQGTVVAVPENGGQPRFWQYQPAPPSSSGGAVWATGGPAVDGAGNVYASTGNPNPVGEEATIYDYSDSVVKLNPAQDFVANPGTELAAPLGSFEPPTWQEESNSDSDLGSAAPELLPGGLLFQAGKSGTGYLIDEATMETGAAAVYQHEVCAGHGSFGGDSFAGGVLYIPCVNGTQALAYDEGARTFSPLWQGPADAFGPPIVSAGLVWSVATGAFKGGGTTLYGLDPSTGTPRYTETLPSPVIDHFASPSAAGGRLFVATGCSVSAYQISQLPPPVATANTSAVPCPSTDEAGGTGEPPAGETEKSSNADTPATAAKAQGSTKAPAQPRVLLLHTHLHVTRGRVHLLLRCTATPKPCRGRIALQEPFLVSRPRGLLRPHTTLVDLASARFGPASGEFNVTLRLDRRAMGRFHRHRNRLSLFVTIAAAEAPAQKMAAVLTQVGTGMGSPRRAAPRARGAPLSGIATLPRPAQTPDAARDSAARTIAPAISARKRSRPKRSALARMACSSSSRPSKRSIAPARPSALCWSNRTPVRPSITVSEAPPMR
jgi:polyvinyl alcohol dehydrogenase (cytochrome)